MNKHPGCWCGNHQLLDFSPDYLRCPACETLVVRLFPQIDLTRITDEEHDVYGANYAEHHLSADYGQPDFATRSRRDLTERCLHWLRAVLKYLPPPADLLELGSFHGGFVGLAQFAGYRARGLELSPAIAAQTALRFGVEILVGPIEQQSIPEASLDIIASFDVLEHLQDPRRTLQACRRLLRPNGILVIQSPRYQAKRSYEQILSEKDPFMGLLLPREHLYLFSEQAVTRLLREIGLNHISFETPIFEQYDMFPFASAAPLHAIEDSLQGELLSSLPGGRFVTALFDLKDESESLLQDNRRLNIQLKQSVQDSTARLQQVEHLTAAYKRSEIQRTQLNDQVTELTELVHVSQHDAGARLKQVEHLSNLLRRSETESANRAGQVERLTAELIAVRVDATARLAQVEHLTKLVDDSQAAAAAQEKQVTALTTLAKSYETESADRDRQIKTLTTELNRVRSDATARLTQIEQLTKLVNESQAAATAQGQQVVTLSALARSHEAESLARFEQVNQLAAHLKSCTSDNLSLRSQIESYVGWLKDAQRDIQLITTAHRDAEKTVHALLKQLEPGEKHPPPA